MFFSNTLGLLKETVKAWSDDYASSMGAALSYYTLFSIAPLLLIVIALAGLVFGRDAARGELLEQLSDLMGKEGARAVEGLLAGASHLLLLAGPLGDALLLFGPAKSFLRGAPRLGQAVLLLSLAQSLGLPGSLRSRFLFATQGGDPGFLLGLANLGEPLFLFDPALSFGLEPGFFLTLCLGCALFRKALIFLSFA